MFTALREQTLNHKAKMESKTLNLLDKRNAGNENWLGREKNS
jgi:hypothetical protein